MCEIEFLVLHRLVKKKGVGNLFSLVAVKRIDFAWEKTATAISPTNEISDGRKR